MRRPGPVPGEEYGAAVPAPPASVVELVDAWGRLSLWRRILCLPSVRVTKAAGNAAWEAEEWVRRWRAQEQALASARVPARR